MVIPCLRILASLLFLVIELSSFASGSTMTPQDSDLFAFVGRQDRLSASVTRFVVRLVGGRAKP